jgi:hypothetical protein
MTGETVTILRPGASTTTDVYGNDVPGPDTRTDVTGCLVAPRLQGDATESGRQGVIIGTTVYFPTGTEVRATDRLEVRGEVHTMTRAGGTATGRPRLLDVGPLQRYGPWRRGRHPPRRGLELHDDGVLDALFVAPQQQLRRLGVGADREREPSPRR